MKLWLDLDPAYSTLVLFEHEVASACRKGPRSWYCRKRQRKLFNVCVTCLQALSHLRVAPIAQKRGSKSACLVLFETTNELIRDKKVALVDPYCILTSRDLCPLRIPVVFCLCPLLLVLLFFVVLSIALDTPLPPMLSEQ